jgi:hypothetical protein
MRLKGQDTRQPDTATLACIRTTEEKKWGAYKKEQEQTYKRNTCGKMKCMTQF